METHSLRVPGLPKFTTRAAEKRDSDIKSSRYVLANQTGADPLHTAWYINERVTRYGSSSTLQYHAPSSQQQKLDFINLNFTRCVPILTKTKRVVGCDGR